MEGCTAHDLDSVAGVLKLYFRSLDPPLFPPDLFRDLLASAGEARAWARLGAADGAGATFRWPRSYSHTPFLGRRPGPQSWRPGRSGRSS